ncbi:MAG: NTP transferase domain-containing protein [Candidatus Hodarchaeales archaeon]|jgi:molybdopterin-guanine dinucleotide biosynthesis protein A
MKKVVIILLAGGKASRYRNSFKPPTNNHHDKLLSKKGDISLLEFVCTELRPLGDIIVATRGKKRKQKYFELLDHNKITVISEDNEKSIGPIGGICTALNLCKKDQTKIIIPADLPNVRKDVIAELITRSAQSKLFDLISLVHPNGQIENLVLISHSEVLLKTSQFLVSRGIHRVSSLIRLISKKRFLNTAFLIKSSDISEVFDDLDSHELIPEIKAIHNPVLTSPQIDFGLDINSEKNQKDPSIFYRKYLDLITNHTEKGQERVPSITTSLLEESIIYKERGLLSLSLHCLLDVYKIKKDPEVKNQINSIMMQLEATERNLYS